MTLHGIPHALPETWNGLSFADYIRFLLEFEPETPAINAPHEWANYCKMN